MSYATLKEAPASLLRSDHLIAAYERGRFPMAHSNGRIYWHDPDPRAVFPLDKVHPNARLVSYQRSNGFSFTMDQCFEQVMCACADREDTWISEDMVNAYTALHHRGLAHSVETWKDDVLIGGIYGVSIGAVFFGESMFSRVTNASKAAFHRLAGHLREQGFLLFDSQYINAHTRSLGAIEIPRAEFRSLLALAVESPSLF